MRLTSIGDTRRYQSGELFLSSSSVTSLNSLGDIEAQRVIGTYLTHSVGTLFHWLSGGNPILINIGFQTLAFVGIVVLLQTALPKHRKGLAFLFLLPSFTIWSSIASKEALVVFCLSVVCAYVLSIWYGTQRMRPYHVLAFVMLIFLKPHYSAAIGYLVAVSWAARYLKQPAVFALGVGFLTLIPLLFVQDEIYQLITQKVIPQHSGHGGSSRPDFWTSQADVLARAPYGMFISYFGPTVGEALAARNPLHVFSFVESLVITAILLLFTFRGLKRMPAFTFFVGIFTTFWVLFPNYPLGAMNFGSAVRYRTGYVVILFLLVAVILSRDTYGSWRSGRSRRRAATRVRPQARSPNSVLSTT